MLQLSVGVAALIRKIIDTTIQISSFIILTSCLYYINTSGRRAEPTVCWYCILGTTLVYSGGRRAW